VRGDAVAGRDPDGGALPERSGSHRVVEGNGMVCPLPLPLHGLWLQAAAGGQRRTARAPAAAVLGG